MEYFNKDKHRKFYKKVLMKSKSMPPICNTARNKETGKVTI